MEKETLVCCIGKTKWILFPHINNTVGKVPFVLKSKCDFMGSFWFYELLNFCKVFPLNDYFSFFFARICIFSYSDLLRKICQNTDFLWPVFSRIRTDSLIPVWEKTSIRGDDPLCKYLAPCAGDLKKARSRKRPFLFYFRKHSYNIYYDKDYSFDDFGF